MRLTKKQKQIVSACNPRYDNFASVNEIKSAKLLARGHYWRDNEIDNYVSVSPTGRREFFEYNLCGPTSQKNIKYWLIMAKKSARLWALGKYKMASYNNEEMWNHYKNEIF